MSVDIKIGLSGQKTRPATWKDVVSNLFWAGLAIVFAYPLVPVMVERNNLSGPFGVLLSSAFGLVAILHLHNAVRIARGLSKQGGDA